MELCIYIKVILGQTLYYCLIFSKFLLSSPRSSAPKGNLCHVCFNAKGSYHSVANIFLKPVLTACA